MTIPRFNVIIIGSGPAGVSAAGALARSGISVALLETGVYAGAENWSGCVYFAESLAAEDCFGPAAVAAAPFERRVVRRGTLLHNGLDVVGLEAGQERTFRDCYTVLRPVYDPYFADLASRQGALHLTGTTVIGLLRSAGRVIGVETTRGPLYADVTFLAEGDASHLLRSEGFERVEHPHYLQGVKAVLTLDASVIEERFRLRPGEGAAYEMLLRDPLIGGRTAHLNIGAFLYTNRDSLSLGYVAPLENIRDNFRGSHDRVYEWLSGLPFVRDLTAGARLSAYGTKLIRSGGPREQPLLVADGFAVGGAACGLGVDIPFPNFTGPASASGLFFARAVRNILRTGGTFDAANLTREYAAPLGESVYGVNARSLTQWPAYFTGTRVLFTRTVDLACGTARFLSEGSLVETGRFLRGHVLSLKALSALVADTARALKSLGLWRPLLTTLFSLSTLWRWTANTIRKSEHAGEQAKTLVLELNGRSLGPDSLPWPVGGLLRRLSPHLASALEEVYANDGRPLDEKFRSAVRTVLRGLALSDVVVLPLYALTLFLAALAVAAADAFRFFVMKTPLDTMLALPAMAYAESQRKARDLDSVHPLSPLEAKLATNTYRVGSRSHIRTLWPDRIPDHPAMAHAGLWWVCPARVYGYDPPQFSGRGRVTVNYENCIKCESCWRAEPLRALWGRHTDHRLIYRPESASLPLLLASLNKEQPLVPPAAVPSRDEAGAMSAPGPSAAAQAVVNASRAFRDSLEKLPASADGSRRGWSLSLARRVALCLRELQEALNADGNARLADLIRSERQALEQRLDQGRLIPALYCCIGIEERLGAPAPTRPAGPDRKDASTPGALSRESLSALFPDRVVKEWEDQPVPPVWEEKLVGLIALHRDEPEEAVRRISSLSPALGVVAGRHLLAELLAGQAGTGTCAVDAAPLALNQTADGAQVTGELHLVPLTAAEALLLPLSGKVYRLPLSTPGIAVVPTPAIGFRAAGLSSITFDCVMRTPPSPLNILPGREDALYLAVALGAADYLAARVKEHAADRVQFGAQMLDTEGRDGIAKLGAVKALLARVESWRMLLQHLYDTRSGSALRDAIDPRSFGLLCSTLAAQAFGPDPGSIGYDAGQVFGGFAYSEDDLLSRCYRDSSVFRFLPPGLGAAERLDAQWDARMVTGLATSVLAGIKKDPLGPAAERVQGQLQQCTGLPAGTDAALAGTAKALLVALSSFLASVEAELERGASAEGQAAACDVLLSLAEDTIMKARVSAGRGAVSPMAVFPLEPVAEAHAAATDYAAFCEAPGEPHRSGHFLSTAFDRTARFVPEMQLEDPGLAERWKDLVDWFKVNCEEKPFEGLPLGRFIEKNHRLPPEIIQAAKDNKWLATYIPRTLDGMGWRKAEYYLLNAAAGSFGDASIDLLIMASTSIGTTPILLGLEDELPRVREELTPLAADEARLGRIGAQLDRIVRSFSGPNPAWIRREYEALMHLVDERIRRTRVVKYLAANFLKAFYGAGIAGRRGDFTAFMRELTRARDLYAGLMPDIRAALAELPLRERCHQRFLKALGHGGVSAFALTEPTAGSDSGGVKTTARLVRSQLTALGDGRYSFLPEGEQEVRYLIDAGRIEFTAQGMAYRTPDGAVQDILPGRSDQGASSYRHQGQERSFHDIGEVRKSAEGLFYEYYVLTGAKMWITNGSVATQLCLYAQSPEGVTGFLVDRHAEGLKVGADEKKMGQRGSPTNEISLDNVRVPREAVIGYEGHGQVNALETLNVGRCGLAVVSGALMRRLLHDAPAVLPPSAVRDRLLGEAAAVLFSSESLAFYLVGLFDRSHESVRMESAIAKYACSEDIHELITLLELAYGPCGQTERFPLEKARRDSRILTIYEGTNEVQRFLVLKDLIASAETWPEVKETAGGEPERTLAAWKNRLRQQVRQARELAGDSAWSDAMLQPALFPLAEAAGELLRLDCIQYRLEWLVRHGAGLDERLSGYRDRMLAAGRRAAQRTNDRLALLFSRADAGLETVRNNRDMPEVVLADSALGSRGKTEPLPSGPAPVLRAPLRALCIIRPVADLSPRPRIIDGRLEELVWKIDPGDLAALSQVRELGSRSAARMVVDVLMPGDAVHDRLLRMTVGTEGHALLRLPSAPDAAPPEYVPCIRDLEAVEQYDLIITGARCSNGDQSLGAYLAGSLKRYHYRRERLETKPDGSGLVHVALPAVLSITARSDAPELPMDRTVGALARPVKVAPTAPGPAAAVYELPAAAPARASVATTPAAAAAFLRSFSASSYGGRGEPYTGELRSGPVGRGAAVWAVIEPHDPRQGVALLRAGAAAAALLGKELRAVIPAPRPSWPQAIGLARANGCAAAYCLDTGEGRLSRTGRRSLVRLLLATSDSALILAPEEWTSTAAIVAGEAEPRSIFTCSGATVLAAAPGGGISFSTPCYDGRLARIFRYPGGQALVTVLPEADLRPAAPLPLFSAFALDTDVNPEWTMPLPPVAPPTLEQAEVIIDLGYGIRDRSGLALAQVLKEKLEALGLSPLFGATRKVTQDLKLLPLEAQIGQTGVRVNPKLIIALGISGAPQHVDYLGARTEILCFNKDGAAPLMTLNRSRLSPRVHPILGDLFVTVRELVDALGNAN